MIDWALIAVGCYVTGYELTTWRGVDLHGWVSYECPYSTTWPRPVVDMWPDDRCRTEQMVSKPRLKWPMKVRK